MGFTGKTLKTRESRSSQVDFTTNSNPISDFLSRRYVGSTKRPFYYVSCAQDKDKKYPLPIALNVIHGFGTFIPKRTRVLKFTFIERIIDVICSWFLSIYKRDVTCLSYKYD